jgi:hypothetical protein
MAEATRRGLLALVILLSVPAASAVLPEWTVDADPGLAGVAEEVRDYPRARLAHTMALYGLHDAGPPIEVRILAEGSRVAAQVPHWISGFALPERSLVVLFPARVPTYPYGSLESLLHHEIAHVLLFRAAGDHHLPRWFGEGMAMLAGRTWGLTDRTYLVLAALASGPTTVEELDAAFEGDERQVQQAYVVSAALVRDLVTRYGGSSVAETLAGVAAGRSFPDAFRTATGVALERAAAAFWRRHRIWHRWVPFLTSSAALWIGVTLLALWAVYRRRRRDAETLERWEAEEEWAHLGPPN